MISIIIPAHNEQSVIGRLLAALVADAQDDEVEIVVVCNGCTDGTASVARRFGLPVTVVETGIASKPHALNLGDELSTGYPRFFVDADVELTMTDVRTVASVLEDPAVLAAAPTMTLRLDDASWAVRQYHHFWQLMPYFDDTQIGSGVYAMSAAGRQRFAAFPNIIADDLFVLRQFAPHERRTVEGSTFVKYPPQTLRSLVRTRTRVLAGQHELSRLSRAATEDDPTELENRAVASRIRRVLGAPRLWLAAPIYVVVYALAWTRARWKFRFGDMRAWERDDTARQAT